MATAREPQDIDPYEVVEKARAALEEAGIVFPSLGVDQGSPSLGLVNFGRVLPEVALRLVEALRRGVAGAQPIMIETPLAGPAAASDELPSP
ncbi:hypothetical protein ABZ897_55400 [Nonomuraea sp. NPDC046802]|uniref:hypothetical protein n=1 Tax=Nonomuraea sp. NPDC046802 TaxID=3154919 RepID=UPI0033F10887